MISYTIDKDSSYVGDEFCLKTTYTRSSSYEIEQCGAYQCGTTLPKIPAFLYTEEYTSHIVLSNGNSTYRVEGKYYNNIPDCPSRICYFTYKQGDETFTDSAKINGGSAGHYLSLASYTYYSSDGKATVVEEEASKDYYNDYAWSWKISTVTNNDAVGTYDIKKTAEITSTTQTTKTDTTITYNTTTTNNTKFLVSFITYTLTSSNEDFDMYRSRSFFSHITSTLIKPTEGDRYTYTINTSSTSKTTTYTVITNSKTTIKTTIGFMNVNSVVFDSVTPNLVYTECIFTYSDFFNDKNAFWYVTDQNLEPDKTLFIKNKGKSITNLNETFTLKYQLLLTKLKEASIREVIWSTSTAKNHWGPIFYTTDENVGETKEKVKTTSSYLSSLETKSTENFVLDFKNLIYFPQKTTTSKEYFYKGSRTSSSWSSNMEIENYKYTTKITSIIENFSRINISTLSFHQRIPETVTNERQDTFNYQFYTFKPTQFTFETTTTIGPIGLETVVNTTVDNGYFEVFASHKKLMYTNLKIRLNRESCFENNIGFQGETLFGRRYLNGTVEITNLTNFRTKVFLNNNKYFKDYIGGYSTASVIPNISICAINNFADIEIAGKNTSQSTLKINTITKTLNLSTFKGNSILLQYTFSSSESKNILLNSSFYSFNAEGNANNQSSIIVQSRHLPNIFSYGYKFFYPPRLITVSPSSFNDMMTPYNIIVKRPFDGGQNYIITRYLNIGDFCDVLDTKFTITRVLSPGAYLKLRIEDGNELIFKTFTSDKISQTVINNRKELIFGYNDEFKVCTGGEDEDKGELTFSFFNPVPDIFALLGSI